MIDDEPNIGKLCRRLITALGHDCETAASASAALDYIAAASGSHSGGAGTSAVQLPGDEDSRGPQHGFDLIVCDYRLGTETADDVIEGIRKIAPELLSRVVIATGATTDAGVQNICERYDLQLIAKPYGSAEIARVLAA